MRHRGHLHLCRIVRGKFRQRLTGGIFYAADLFPRRRRADCDHFLQQVNDAGFGFTVFIHNILRRVG
jgi:hypothetical protein